MPARIGDHKFFTFCTKLIPEDECHGQRDIIIQLELH